MKKVVIICGGREYRNSTRMEEIILEEKPTFIIEGDAPGADKLAGLLAQKLNIDYAAIPALWTARGKSAGPRRNHVMAMVLKALSSNSEMKILAFPGDVGTSNMVTTAELQDIPVRKIDWDD